MSYPSIATSSGRLSTGIEGLDAILGGGLPRGRVYLVEGSPGTGKTTVALQFILEGVRRNERVIYFALSESRAELEAVAASHGWSLEAANIHEVIAVSPNGESDEPYTLFHPSEVELSDTIKTICQEVGRTQPVRVVIDSLAEMRLMAQDPLIYRRQVLALKQFFVGQQCTVLLLDDRRPHDGDPHFQSLVHGVFSLEQSTPVYGAKRRQVEVVKLRGVQFYDGRHDLAIRKGGVVVFPRLAVAKHYKPFEPAVVTSGIEELDILLGGGLERGTSTLILGPSGVGKSTLASQFALAAAHRGGLAVLYTFDETRANFLARADGLGMGLRAQVEAGGFRIQQVNPAELSPGEFVQRVRHDVEHDRARVVVIDSLNGYINAVPAERYLVIQMHELVTYLDEQGVVSILVEAQHGLVGSVESPVDVSYVADTTVLLRYFEAAGEVRKAISVVKKRTGGHEAAIREIRLGPPQGIRVGQPLQEFQGVLTGTPTYGGKTGLLLGGGDEKSGT